MTGGAINVCPRDGEPVIFTFEFPGVEYFCVVCGFGDGMPYGWTAPATPELSARHAELRYRYDCERAEREGRPKPEPPTDDGERPTCIGCGKVAEGAMDGDKPAHWFKRTKDGVDQFACSRECIPERQSITPW